MPGQQQYGYYNRQTPYQNASYSFAQQAYHQRYPQQQYNQQQYNQQKKPDNKDDNTTLYIAVGAIVIIILIGVIGYFVMFTGGPSLPDSVVKYVKTEFNTESITLLDHQGIDTSGTYLVEIDAARTVMVKIETDKIKFAVEVTCTDKSDFGTCSIKQS